MIEGGQIADPMGVSSEDRRDSRAEVVPHSRGTEGPELVDGVAPRADRDRRGRLRRVDRARWTLPAAKVPGPREPRTR